MTDIRVRFAPSPTGRVHIGNIRVAVFNHLFARHEGGEFLLRIEDTDLERSTPEAVAGLIETMEWLGLDHDGDIIHQTAQRSRHEYEADRLQNLGMACRNDDDFPAVLFMLGKDLYDPSFVTDPEEEASIDLSKAAETRATVRNLVIVDRNSKGEEFLRPVPWDAIEADLVLRCTDGTVVPGADALAAVRGELGDDPRVLDEVALEDVTGAPVERVDFRRRFVFFEDLVLGLRRKPLDGLRDFVVVRGDGSPVFHLANVVDDVSMGVTHILRGNDHLENTFRHLFLFRALGADFPRWGHFPMIVNEKGKPYSKRDGDAYVGDFREKGYLPEALVNFLALLGWSPGDDREKMTRDEMAEAFTLDRVGDTPARFDAEKLEWLNGQYMMEKSFDELAPLLLDALAEEGVDVDGIDPDWFRRLVEIHRERMHTIREFVERTGFFFADEVTVDMENKKVRKLVRKEKTRETLSALAPLLESLSPWTEEHIETALKRFGEENEIKMGDIGQPLRVAVTGSTVSPAIQETLFLIGRERVLARIAAAVAFMTEQSE